MLLVSPEIIKQLTEIGFESKSDMIIKFYICFGYEHKDKDYIAAPDIDEVMNWFADKHKIEIVVSRCWFGDEIKFVYEVFDLRKPVLDLYRNQSKISIYRDEILFDSYKKAAEHAFTWLIAYIRDFERPNIEDDNPGHTFKLWVARNEGFYDHENEDDYVIGEVKFFYDKPEYKFNSVSNRYEWTNAREIKSEVPDYMFKGYIDEGECFEFRNPKLIIF